MKERIIEKLKEFSIINQNGKVSHYFVSHIERNIELKKLLMMESSHILDTSPKSFHERLHCILQDIHEIPKCECGNNVTYNIAHARYNQFCCKPCRYASEKLKKKITDVFLKKYGETNPLKNKEIKAKANATNLERYGTTNVLLNPEIQKKRQETMIEQHGVANALQSTKIINEMEQHNLEKYGVKHTLTLPEVRRKSVATLKEKYGVEHVSQIQDVREKIKNTYLCKHGVNHHKQKHFSENVIKNLTDVSWCIEQHHTQHKPLSQIAEELNVNGSTVQLYFHNNNIEIKRMYRSAGEIELCSFIEQLGVDVLTNVRNIIHPHELDIYIPKQNIAFEYCGLYWHCEAQGKDKWYHLTKMKKCSELGIRLITIYEDEWMGNKYQVKEKIKSLLNKDDRPKVYARNTNIKEICTKSKKDFLDKYHIQQDGPGSVNYGIYQKEELIGVVTFIKTGYNYTLNRYATKKRIVGGFSKILAHFKNNNRWKNITTFADLRWSNGNLYNKTEFSEDKILPPDYFYIKGCKRFHKFNYRRKYLKDKLAEFDEVLSEVENCNANGLQRLWDCGKIRFVLKNKQYLTLFDK